MDDIDDLDIRQLRALRAATRTIFALIIYLRYGDVEGSYKTADRFCARLDADWTGTEGMRNDDETA